MKKPSIQFLKGISEKTLPFVKLTKSKNGKTGTATFLFINPLFFNSYYDYNFIDGVNLIWENKVIKTNDLKIFFKNGKPFIIKVIFIFKNSYEWFAFLNFMSCFSKQTGLYFSETTSSFN